MEQQKPLELQRPLEIKTYEATLPHSFPSPYTIKYSPMGPLDEPMQLVTSRRHQEEEEDEEEEEERLLVIAHRDTGAHGGEDSDPGSSDRAEDSV